MEIYQDQRILIDELWSVLNLFNLMNNKCPHYIKSQRKYSAISHLAITVHHGVMIHYVKD